MARIQMSATDSVYRHNWLLVLHTVACQNCNTPCVLETDKYCKMSLVWSVHRKMWIRVRVGLGLGLRVRVRVRVRVRDIVTCGTRLQDYFENTETDTKPLNLVLSRHA